MVDVETEQHPAAVRETTKRRPRVKRREVLARVTVIAYPDGLHVEDAEAADAPDMVPVALGLELAALRDEVPA